MNSQDKQKEIEALESKKEIVDAKYSELCKKRRAELKVIEDKYEAEKTSLEAEIESYKNDISNSTRDKKILIVEEEWQEAVSRGEVNEFYLMSLIKKLKFDTYGKDIKHKLHIQKNDIDVWMIVNDSGQEYKLYLAFYKDMLVGISFRHTAQHAGDDTYPFSFIGDFENRMDVTKVYKDGFHEGKEYTKDATFTDWMRELKKLDLEDTELLPMNTDTLDELKKGVKTYWNYYGWPDKIREQKELNQ